MEILNNIGLNFKTDKSSEGHDYLNKYERYLPFTRKDHIKILEIGVLNGASLNTWSEYFYNSEIVGIDINSDCKKLENRNVKIEIGSQNNTNFIDFIFYKYKNFDLVIDDGSHQNSDIIFSFERIFPRMKSGGIYIVEDSCTSYWEEYGGGLLNQNSAIEYFKKKVDESNFFGARIKRSENWHFRKDYELLNQFKEENNYLFGMDIESINFLNSIIIVTKR
jgi:hypothetical protein